MWDHLWGIYITLGLQHLGTESSFNWHGGWHDSSFVKNQGFAPRAPRLVVVSVDVWM